MRCPRGSMGIPSTLWRMVALAHHRLLMLDYDGTLAPFTPDREQAHPIPQSLEMLRRLALSFHTSVAIVSGRPLHEVERLVGPLPAIFVGEHGWERRTPDGDIVRGPLQQSAKLAINHAERLARDAGWGPMLERKRSSVVLHTRGLAQAHAHTLHEKCYAAWEPIVSGGHVVLDRIDGGLELRASSRNKGTVVLSLLTHSALGTLGVFVGDDVSDEDAFEVVRDWGFGVCVGSLPRTTIAAGRLPSCDALPGFLEEWLRIMGRRDNSFEGRDSEA